MSSVRKTLISAKPIDFLRNLPEKKTQNPSFVYRLLSGQVYPENSGEIDQFFRDFVLKNSAKFDFFFHELSEALPY